MNITPVYPKYQFGQKGMKKKTYKRDGFFILQVMIVCIFCMITILTLMQWFSWHYRLQKCSSIFMQDLLEINAFMKEFNDQYKDVKKMQSGSQVTCKKSAIILSELQQYAIKQPINGYHLIQMRAESRAGKKIMRMIGMLDVY